MKAIIKKVSHGRLKGQYRFVLKAKNGEIIAVSHPETYHNIQDAMNIIKSAFPNFEIISDGRNVDTNEKDKPETTSTSSSTSSSSTTEANG